jgi:tRNA 2-selenouridine synthase
LNLENIKSENLIELFLNGTPLIDVRAPIEFELGSLPNAINLPILNNEERAQVGTVYKNQGQEVAVMLGHKLISGQTKKERIQGWLNFIVNNPTATIYCFRGGMRSQITQQWLRDAGINRPLLIGGYKNARQVFIEKLSQFSMSHPFISLCGPTGSGKTQFLNMIKGLYPTIDLEAIARHRGSAFGALRIQQPTQINFENLLALAFFKLEKDHSINSNNNTSKIIPPILFEDESRLIGKCILPNIFFEKLQCSPVIWINETIEHRVQNIFQEYILNSPIGSLKDEEALPQFTKYKNSLQSISKKLGGLRTDEIRSLIETAELDFIETKGLIKNNQWIEKLLVYYYDPLYLKSIKNRNVKILFKGTKSECLDFLKNGESYATSKFY